MGFSEKQKEVLEKKQYGVVLNHSSVQVCEWTKKSLRGFGDCYKKKFYGANTHKCAEISPATLVCTHNCLYCWRPVEYMNEFKITDWDDPKQIIDEVIIKRKKLLSGFGGRLGTSKEYFEDALVPDHFAISLSGEPTLYHKIDKLISYLKDDYNARTIFLVSNASMPETLLKISKNPPTQLYLSINAYNEEIFHKITKKGSWNVILKSLENIPKYNTRTVIRVTLIKDYNMENPKDFAYFLDNYKEDFIELKSYMWIGNSRLRLEKANMPTFEEINLFANEFSKYSKNYEIVDEHIPSRIILLKRKDSKYNTKIYND